MTACAGPPLLTASGGNSSGCSADVASGAPPPLSTRRDAAGKPQRYTKYAVKTSTRPLTLTGPAAAVTFEALSQRLAKGSGSTAGDGFPAAVQAVSNNRDEAPNGYPAGYTFRKLAHGFTVRGWVLDGRRCGAEAGLACVRAWHASAIGSVPHIAHSPPTQ